MEAVEALERQPGPKGLAFTFRALRHRNYRLYFFGQLVSITGSWMQSTALSWLAFELTHQSKWPALITAASILPTCLLGLWGGGMADRWPKRSLIFVTQCACLVQALLLVVMVHIGFVRPWPLFVISMFGGLIQAIDFPARLAFVIDLAGREDLMNAVALNSLMFNVARIVGPALAGVILAYGEPQLCFLLNALSYLAVLWALARMDILGRPAASGSKPQQGHLLDSLRYLRTHGELTFLLLLAGITAFCGWPALALLPALSNHRFDSSEQGFSFMLSSVGLGALIAAWVVATFGSAERRSWLIGVGVALVCCSLFGLSQATTLLLACADCSVLGFGLVMMLATSQSVVQLGAAGHNRGRIMGIWAVVLSGAVPIGSLIVGPAADRWGESMILFIQGVACGVAGLGLALAYRIGVRGRVGHSVGGSD